MLEIDEGIGSPQALPQLFASDQLSGSCEQRRQDLKRLVLELETVPLAPELSAAQISFVFRKTNDAGAAVHLREDSKNKKPMIGSSAHRAKGAAGRRSRLMMRGCD